MVDDVDAASLPDDAIHAEACSSRSSTMSPARGRCSRSLAENYVGLPLPPMAVHRRITLPGGVRDWNFNRRAKARRRSIGFGSLLTRSSVRFASVHLRLLWRALVAASASAQSVVKLGMVGEFSGPFAQYGQQILGGMKAYMKLNGDTVAGKKIEIVQKDTTGPRRTSPSGWRRSSSPATTSTSWSALAYARMRWPPRRWRPRPRS